MSNRRRPSRRRRRVPSAAPGRYTRSSVDRDRAVAPPRRRRPGPSTAPLEVGRRAELADDLPAAAITRTSGGASKYRSGDSPRSVRRTSCGGREPQDRPVAGPAPAPAGGVVVFQLVPALAEAVDQARARPGRRTGERRPAARRASPPAARDEMVRRGVVALARQARREIEEAQQVTVARRSASSDRATWPSIASSNSAAGSPASPRWRAPTTRCIGSGGAARQA